jgi:hypothetical protein
VRAGETKLKSWVIGLGTAWIASGLWVIAPAAAQSYKVEKANDSPPAELSAAVRGTLSSDALKVTGPNGPLCEVWLRKSVPAAAPTQEMDVTFRQIAEGTLAGAIRFPGDVKDFRRQTIHAGVYTLRYALIPVDGNHLGVSEQRDFLLIGPAAADADPALLTRDQTLDLSRKATGSNHPSVWSLGPVAADGSSLPAVTHDEADDTWMLEFQLALEGGGGPVPMALIVAGHAPDI